MQIGQSRVGFGAFCWRFVWRRVGIIKSSGRMRRRNGRERASSQLVKFLICPKIMFSQPVDRVMRTSIVPSLGFRIARGLLERPAYREFFAAGLTVFDPVKGSRTSGESSRTNLLARREVQNLMREIGLLADDAELEDESLHEIEPSHD